MYSRLKRNHKLIKTASVFQTLDSIILNSGDNIDFEVKITANRPWFQIIHNYSFSNSSYYDGPDFDRACELYEELLIAFKGVRLAEQFRKKVPIFKTKIDNLKQENKSVNMEDHYHALKRNPLFLGINEF